MFTQHMHFLIGEGENIEPPADHHHEYEAQQDQCPAETYIFCGHIGQGPQLPVGNGRKLGIRVRHVLDDTQDGTHEACHNDTGKHKHDNGILPDNPWDGHRH